MLISLTGVCPEIFPVVLFTALNFFSFFYVQPTFVKDGFERGHSDTFNPFTPEISFNFNKTVHFNVYKWKSSF